MLTSSDLRILRAEKSWKIGDDVFVEWRNPEVRHGAGGVDVKEVVVEGIRCLRIVIPDIEGWIRLCVSPPPLSESPRPALLACRLAFQVSPTSGASVSEVHAMLCRSKHGAKGRVSREGMAKFGQRARVESGSWIQADGLFACDASNPFDFDLLVNLPAMTEVIVAVLDVQRIPAEISGTVAEVVAQEGVLEIEPLRLVEITSDRLWEIAGAGTAIRSAICLDGDVLSGHVLARPQPASILVEAGGMEVACPLSESIELVPGVSARIGFRVDTTELKDQLAARDISCRIAPEAKPFASIGIPHAERRLDFGMRLGADLRITCFLRDSHEPDRHLSVRLQDAAGTDYGVFRADREIPVGRDKASGHGVFIDMPQALLDGALHEISVFPEGLPDLAETLFFSSADGGFGEVTSIGPDEVSGWAVTLAAPTARLPIGAWLGEEPIGHAMADGFCSSATELLKIDGFQGFKMRLTQILTPDDLDTLEVRTAIDGAILRIPAELLREAKRRLSYPIKDAHEDASITHGCVEKVDARGASGWALRPENLDEPLTVGLYLDGVHIESVLADKPHGNLVKKFGGSGRHGFHIPFPPGLDYSVKRKLEIRVEGTGEKLPGEHDSLEIPKVGLQHEKTLNWGEIKTSEYRWVSHPVQSVGQPRFDVIILNRNGAAHLENLLASFSAHCRYPDYRLIVVDHGSVDESRAVCESWSARLPVEFHNRGANFGFSESNNFGTALGEGAFLLFLNNDIILSECILTHLARHLADDRVGAVGMQLVSPVKNPDGTIAPGFVQHRAVRFARRPDMPLIAPFEQPTVLRRDIHTEGIVWRVPAVTGAALAIRRDDFEKLGGFDERFFYGYEDIDLCLGVQISLEKPVICATDIQVFHIRGASRSVESHETRRRYAKNLELLSTRFGARVRQELRSDIVDGGRFWRMRPLRLAFAVSTTDMAAPEADFFTAYELGEELVTQFGWDISYLAPDDWYDLAEFDVVVAMRPDFSIPRLKSDNPNLIIIGWARNWFDRWLTLPWLDAFDMIWAASEKARAAFHSRTQVPVELVRIATKASRFVKPSSNAAQDETLASDYCFSGSFFKAPRDIVSTLDPDAMPWAFAIFGHGWDQIGWLAPYWRGPFPYTDMPKVYAATRLVIDDCNSTVKPWGSVNSRVFDALSAGALVITNGDVGALEVFDGLLPVWRNQKELQTLIDRYLTDEPARQKLVARLRQVVLDRHTYAHRADAVGTSLKRLFKSLRYGLHDMTPQGQRGNPALGDVVADRLRASGCFVRRHDIGRPNVATGTLGDDVSIYVMGEQGMPDITPRTDQVNLLLLFGSADNLSVAEARRFDILVMPTETDAAALRALGLKALALFEDEAARSAAYAVDSENRISFADMPALRSRLDMMFGELVGASEALNTTKYDHTVVRCDTHTANAVLSELPPARLFFWPDYRATNPYQQLMYEEVSATLDTQPGTLDSAQKALDTRSDRRVDAPPAPVIFHLHWTSPIIGNETVPSLAAAKIRDFVERLRRFVADGGHLVWTLHNLIPHEAVFPALEAELAAAIVDLAEVVHVHGARTVALAKDQFRLPAEKVVVAPHGSYIGFYPNDIGRAEARSKLGLPVDARVLVFFGQIRDYKGLDILLEAFAKMRADCPQQHLVIAGKPINFDMEALRERAGAISGITLALREFADDEIQIPLCAADHVVLPYANVLTSGSLYLALSFGRPVIAPAIGLIPDAIQDGVEGFLYDPADPDGLATALQRAAALDDAARKLQSEAALNRAKASTWNSIHSLLDRDVQALAAGRVRILHVGDEVRRCVIAGPETPPPGCRVAAVVLHYGHADDTIRCVQALLDQDYRRLHIYIVSNDEDATAFRTFAQLFPNTTVIQSPANLGYAGGNNIALALARETHDFDYGWIVNPDTIAPKHYLGQMLALADKDSNVSIFGSKIVFGDRPERVWFAGGLVSWNDGLTCEHAFIGKPANTIPDSPVPCDYITGASLMFRFDVISRIGLLPEDYFLYFEETEWCLRAGAAGLRSVAYPSVTLAHHKRSEDAGAPTPTFLYYYIRNALHLTATLQPESLVATQTRLRGLLDRWLARVAEMAPERMDISRAAAEAGLRDGLSGVRGRVLLPDA